MPDLFSWTQPCIASSEFDSAVAIRTKNKAVYQNFEFWHAAIISWWVWCFFIIACSSQYHRVTYLRWHCEGLPLNHCLVSVAQTEPSLQRIFPEAYRSYGSTPRFQARERVAFLICRQSCCVLYLWDPYFSPMLMFPIPANIGMPRRGIWRRRIWS